MAQPPQAGHPESRVLRRRGVPQSTQMRRGVDLHREHNMMTPAALRATSLRPQSEQLWFGSGRQPAHSQPSRVRLSLGCASLHPWQVRQVDG